MNRALTLILTLVFGTCLLAQSSNSRFIDSPSWVLAGDGNLADLPSPVAAEREQKKAGRGNTPSLSSQASSKSRPRTSANEGFFHLGIYVAPTLNWLSSVDKDHEGERRYERTGSNFAATPTIMLDMRLFRRFYVGFGIAYNTWGGKISNINDKYDSYRSYSFSYVEVPVRIKLQTRNFADSRASLFLSAGANLGFGVDYSYKDKYKDIHITSPISGTGNFVTNSQKIDEGKKLANLSAVGQIGLNYQIGRRLNLIFGVEYHYGFIRPLKTGKDSQWLDFNNQQVGLVLGIMF